MKGLVLLTSDRSGLHRARKREQSVRGDERLPAAHMGLWEGGHCPSLPSCTPRSSHLFFLGFSQASGEGSQT